jgi:hypothetical protein
MSNKVMDRKKSRAYKSNRNEDYGYDKDAFKRDVKKARKDKSARLDYELNGV